MRPTSRMLKLVLAWTLLGIIASIWPVLQIGWIGAGVLLLAVALADIATLPRKNGVTAVRAASARFALGVRGTVTLSLQHNLHHPLPVRMHDGLPAWSEADGLPWEGVLPPGEVTHLTYDLHFTRRGMQTFSPAHVLAGSRLGFWERLHRAGAASETKRTPAGSSTQR